MDAGVGADQPAQDAVAPRELARGLVPERRLHRVGDLRGAGRRPIAAGARLAPARRAPSQRASSRGGKWYITRLSPERDRWAVRFCAVIVVAACLLALSGVARADRVAAADPNKVLHVAIEAGDDGFDPSRSTNYYSGLIEEVIFERLLTYDYLAEPVKLVPMLAEAMPEVTDGGKTYTFHLRKGIFFTPDPAFKSDKRELDRGGRRLFDQALHGSEESLAVAVSVRRQDRRPERAGSAGQEKWRPLRLRRQGPRARGRRSLHDPHSSHRHRLQLRLHPGVADDAASSRAR